ncbi:flagellar assembly protein FliW [Alkalicoccobacillus plakortidis]|uniref:Flagellar assembly factor FliW n=1 Tax=Alkalicoccobacillus plakortidis TaxID=444060 RepID=A0ABT0XIG1_9BACI|nr:flagellar assembly protein FliW [Alkalicoccobacillus plakortidis]MCM2675695.1 flagellar assembly protein FliW [Alkalicoccobacillus plakortidis]
MNIHSKYFGEISIHENEQIIIPAGLPAFEDQKKYVLLPFDEGTPFFVLQSTEKPEVAFITVSPFQYIPDYQLELSDSTIKQLKIQKEEDVAVYVLLTVQDPFEQTTANLQAPVIVNTHSKIGKQVFTNESIYHTKHAIFKPVHQKEVK